MQKSFMALTAAAAAAAAAAVIVVAAEPVPGAMTAVNVVGTPEIYRYGEEVAVFEGSGVELNDRVSTDELSRVDIVLAGQWGYRLLEDSQCDIVEAEGEAKINLVHGQLIASVETMEEGSTFTVETPTAVAAVRGTQFWGRAGDDFAPAAFAVWRGSVDVTVKATGESYTLQEGDAFELASDGKALKRKASDAELQALFQADEIPVAG